MQHTRMKPKLMNRLMLTGTALAMLMRVVPLALVPASSIALMAAFQPAYAVECDNCDDPNGGGGGGDSSGDSSGGDSSSGSNDTGSNDTAQNDTAPTDTTPIETTQNDMPPCTPGSVGGSGINTGGSNPGGWGVAWGHPQKEPGDGSSKPGGSKGAHAPSDNGVLFAGGLFPAGADPSASNGPPPDPDRHPVSKPPINFTIAQLTSALGMNAKPGSTAIAAVNQPPVQVALAPNTIDMIPITLPVKAAPSRGGQPNAGNPPGGGQTVHSTNFPPPCKDCIPGTNGGSTPGGTVGSTDPNGANGGNPGGSDGSSGGQTVHSTNFPLPCNDCSPGTSGGSMPGRIVGSTDPSGTKAGNPGGTGGSSGGQTVHASGFPCQDCGNSDPSSNSNASSMGGAFGPMHSGRPNGTVALGSSPGNAPQVAGGYGPNTLIGATPHDPSYNAGLSTRSVGIGPVTPGSVVPTPPIMK
jgi:hypothetical protein